MANYEECGGKRSCTEGISLFLARGNKTTRGKVADFGKNSNPGHLKYEVRRGIALFNN